MPHSPAYAYYKPISKNKEKETIKNELYKNRIKGIKTKWEEHKVSFIDDVSVSYSKLNRIIGSPCYTLVFL
jgi:hypothetical protein